MQLPNKINKSEIKTFLYSIFYQRQTSRLLYEHCIVKRVQIITSAGRMYTWKHCRCRRQLNKHSYCQRQLCLSLLHAPVSHISFLKGLEFYWIRCVSFTFARPWLLDAAQLCARVLLEGEGTIGWPHIISRCIHIPTTKANLPRTVFHDWLILLSGTFCFSLFGSRSGVTHHSYYNQTSGEPNGARVFARNSTATFEMSRLSQPRKWEVRPYGCFLRGRPRQRSGSIQLPTGVFAVFLCGDKKNVVVSSTYCVTSSSRLTLPSRTVAAI